jgi:hypothetical protein
MKKPDFIPTPLLWNLSLVADAAVTRLRAPAYQRLCGPDALVHELMQSCIPSFLSISSIAYPTESNIRV